MAEKRCSKCGLMKKLEDFRKSPRNTGGLRTWCNSCWSQYAREHAPQQRAARRRYIKKRPEVATAHEAARRVPLAPHCEECGVVNTRLHKHHPDYSKPSQVITLCVPCHEKVHHA